MVTSMPVYQVAPSWASARPMSDFPLPRSSSNGFRVVLNPNQSQASRQPAWDKWPWRGLAFCSDLGTIGYLIHKPKLGALGWAIAAPYYLFALTQAPRGRARQEEALYQSTANGLFPLMEAKLGVVAGQVIHSTIQKCVSTSPSKFAQSRLLSLLRSSTFAKITGGVLAVTTLTTTVGDRLSNKIVQFFHTQFDSRERS